MKVSGAILLFMIPYFRHLSVKVIRYLRGFVRELYASNTKKREGEYVRQPHHTLGLAVLGNAAMPLAIVLSRSQFDLDD